MAVFQLIPTIEKVKIRNMADIRMIFVFSICIPPKILKILSIKC